jgi:hypothetical protein
MPRVYELPTHLHVEDTLLFGLTARQLVRLLVCAALAYELWDVSPGLPTPPRIGLAAAFALCGLLFALFRPGGRPLDQWLLAIVLFYLLPRRRTWRRTAPIGFEDQERGGWAELRADPDWLPETCTRRPSPCRHGSKTDDREHPGSAIRLI